MRFSDYMMAEESEGADWGFFGSFMAILGNGKSETLNYGTGTGFSGPAMLYVPLERDSAVAGVVASARRKIARRGIQCVKNPSAFSGYDCGPAVRPHQADIMHTGESHITVAMGASLTPFFGQAHGYEDKVRLLESVELPDGKPLFKNGVGTDMPVNVDRTAPIIYGVARYFRGEPMVALLQVQCPKIHAVRNALGLTPMPANYKTHVTIGYAFGVDLGDIKSTDRKLGSATASASTIHNATYRSQHEWLLSLGIDQFITESI